MDFVWCVKRWMPRLCLIVGLFGMFFPVVPILGQSEIIKDTLLPKKTRKRLSVLPVPAIGYEIETRGYLGAVSLFTLRAKDTLTTRTSNFKVEAKYTMNKQLILEGGGTFFLPQEKYLIQGTVGYLYFPEYYWGIGSVARYNSSELYTARRVEADIALMKSVSTKRKIFVGALGIFQSLFDLEYPNDRQMDTLLVPGKKGGISSGIGGQMLWDTRDNLLNAKKGYYLRLRQSFFRPEWGSDYVFSAFGLDARYYRSLDSLGKHIVAVQSVIKVMEGDVPFRMMSLLGSQADMRGYYQGRFRDLQYACIQAEYRAKIFWRIGGTIFGGVGNVAPRWGDFFADALKPSYGLGLRFLTDRKQQINLRFDYAFALDNNRGFYVSFGEAF